MTPAASAGFTPDPRLAWWTRSRFGLFVHWGPYSIAGVEASWPIMEPGLVAPIGSHQKIAEADYLELAQRFDPRAFDADRWVASARAAGMRYIVLTSKHHDGYCLFDAPSRDGYKSTASPAGRDLVAELAEACDRADLPFGVYYSPPDLHHPAYRDTSRPARENWWGEPERPQWSEYLDAMEADLRHLLTAYGDLAVLWFDGLFAHDQYDPARFHRLVQELSPKTLVNDRLGAHLADYVTPEQTTLTGIPVRRAADAPEVTLEQFQGFVRLLENGATAEQLATLFAGAQRSRFPTEPMPSPERFQPWETCMTIGRTWAFDPQETDYKSTRQLIETLVQTASCGGNLLLNVGPRPDGTWPQPIEQRLAEVGRWLDRYGEAIYGTTWATGWGPLDRLDDLRTTQRGDTTYVFLAGDGSAAESIRLPRIGPADAEDDLPRVTWLGTDSALPARWSEDRSQLEVAVDRSVGSSGPGAVLEVRSGAPSR